MPNWCLNEIRVFCPDEETADAFLKYCEGTCRETVPMGPDNEGIDQMVHTTLQFGSIIPEPKHTIEGVGSDLKFILENGEPYDWYNWRVGNWGVKWEPDIIQFDREDDTTLYWEAYTAWGPPEGIYNKMMEDWEDKNVTISWFYREDGMQFAGWLPD